MEHIETFLDTSTIHGLSWISGSRRLSKIFWIIVVIGGFSGAGYLISTSFKNWEQSPITTTVAILPMSEIKFPNITICPPKESFLNLNYAIMESKKIKLSDKTRQQLLDDAIGDFQEEYTTELMNNLTKIQDPDRYFNWYKGITEIRYPYYNYFTINYHLTNKIHTTAVKGNISIQYFGKIFDVAKIVGDLYSRIDIIPPRKYQWDYSGKLKIVLRLEKNAMSSLEFERLELYAGKKETIDAGLKHVTRNLSTIRELKISYYRKLFNQQLNTSQFDKMPGFRLTWFYNSNLEPIKKFSKDIKTNCFIR